jgi:hypothetical protein
MIAEAPDDLSVVLVHLMRGIVERDSTPQVWQILGERQSRVRDYVSVIGLDLEVDEAEGYAFLRQRPIREGEPELPRLVARRQLSYPVSLLLALLRKRLAEHDAASSEPRLILTTREIVDLVRLFQPETADEARLEDRVSRDIAKVVELGFLKLLKGREGTYEVRRILRSFIDAQWLGTLDERLAEYATHGGRNEDRDVRASDRREEAP